jgi:hypothetical protein
VRPRDAIFVADSSSRSADPVSRRRFRSSDRGDAGYLRTSGKIASSARQIENPHASRTETISVLWYRPKSSGRVFKRPSALSKRCRMSERYCILCVDEDVICLEARAALLEQEGYSVTAVSCPLRTLEFDVTKFHLAVLDFAMPALNGSALATFACSTSIFPDRVAQRNES